MRLLGNSALLTGHFVHRTMHPMSSISLRQWVACGLMLAMLFSIAAPLALCRCANSCCGETSTPVQNTECCGPSETLCQCVCCNYREQQTSEPITLEAVLPVKRPDVKPSWDASSVLPVGFAPATNFCLRLNNHRLLPFPHVPLHVLLCVFLN